MCVALGLSTQGGCLFIDLDGKATLYQFMGRAKPCYSTSENHDRFRRHRDPPFFQARRSSAVQPTSLSSTLKRPINSLTPLKACLPLAARLNSEPSRIAVV